MKYFLLLIASVALINSQCSSQGTENKVDILGEWYVSKFDAQFECENYTDKNTIYTITFTKDSTYKETYRKKDELTEELENTKWTWTRRDNLIFITNNIVTNTFKIIDKNTITYTSYNEVAQANLYTITYTRKQ